MFADLVGQVAAMELTLSVRSRHVPANTFYLRLAAELTISADFARHARHFRRERAKLVDHRVMVFFNSRNFAAHLHVILRERSPFATRVVTSAMFRTWAVKLPAIEFTESVKILHVPATPRPIGLAAKQPLVPTSRATRVTSAATS